MSMISFVVWSCGMKEFSNFQGHLNSIYPNIRFTMEIEGRNMLPFLVVLRTRKPDALMIHTIYRKSHILIYTCMSVSPSSKVPKPYTTQNSKWRISRKLSGRMATIQPISSGPLTQTYITFTAGESCQSGHRIPHADQLVQDQLQ
jgi:hypothetical protein